MTFFTSLFRKKNVLTVNPDGGWFLSDSESRYAGRHILIDMFGVQSSDLVRPKRIERLMKKAAKDAGATVLNSYFHEFTGGGVTGVLALAESHMSIHTWPEEGVATIDIFMCGQCDPTRTIMPLRVAFSPKSFKVQEFKRARSSLFVQPQLPL